jgi:hypothetical protein
MNNVANAAPTANPLAVPHVLGLEDALCNEPCVPEMYFVRRYRRPLRRCGCGTL